MAGNKHKLSLLENSHSFLKEAAGRGVAALEDVSHWPFAILSLVQAVELSLKEILRGKHPSLIYQNIDRPRNTVSIEQAIVRLQNPMIGGIVFPESEKKRLRSAISLRNQIIHHEFELVPEHAMGQFSEILAFLIYLQQHYLDEDITSILSDELWQSVIGIEECYTELKNKAFQRIKNEEINEDDV